MTQVAVVCEDRPLRRAALERVLSGAGFTVAEGTGDFGRLPELVGRTGARLVVVSLPLTGMTGLQAVRQLRAGAPDCEVVVVSSSDRLELAALEAGALALVPEDDLRVLRDVARQQVQASGSVRTNPAS